MFPPDAPELLPRVLSESCAGDVARWESAAVGSGLDPARAPRAITRVFACSPFVAEFACRAPAAFLALVEAPAGSVTLDASALRGQLADELEGCAEEAHLRQLLRRFRQRELVRIAWHDLTGALPLEGVLAATSALADALVIGALEWLARQFDARFGQPRDDRDAPMPLLVLAMGKLGGGELNFSSDIDLIFLYRAAGETTGGARALSHQEYFDRLGKRLIACLNDATEDGFVYRVDMRLRPFGDSGALTMNLGALEHYYQVHGRDWERYALIKGRLLNGDALDAQALEAITRPFVYRRYLDFGALEAVREMKALINAEVARYGLEDDVKRGPGGIREIEFIGQMFQLIRGGREPRLRQRPIVAVLEVCASLGLLGTEDTEGLIAAYRFLRVTEHRLQQVRDEQTQQLPANELERLRLAFGLGYHDWRAFETALAGHRDVVRRCFGGLLYTRDEAPAPDADLLWRHADDLDRTQEMLGNAGFTQADNALGILSQLKDPRFLGRLSVEARARLDRLMPLVVTACAAHEDGATVLAHLAELVRAVARRSVYLALLADNPPALARLVDLCAASAWVAREVVASPILLDELLDNRTLFAPPRRARVEEQLDDALTAVGDDGLERIMDTLRVFKHQQVFRVAASDLMSALPVAEVSNHLTWIAEVLIERARELAWDELVAKHGRPRFAAAAGGLSAGFAIIAYGKLGGLELGYGSDLDLVFVHDSRGSQDQTDGPRSIANDVFFTRLAQRIIHLLATRTPAGIAYELDVRLRPSGAAGLLVTSLTAFEEYQLNAAWTWEHQALVRARAVAGSPEVQERFAAIRRDVLSRRREPLELRRQIADMRERMRRELDRSGPAIFDLKHGQGGITDIEFVVQYAVLRWAGTYRVLSTYTDNLRLLDLIADLGVVTRGDSETLRAAYFAYRAEVHRCALQEIDGLVDARRFAAERRAVAAVWARVMNPDGEGDPE